MPFFAGQRLAAADLNMVAASYRRTTAQSIPTGVDTRISGYTLESSYGGLITESSGVLTLGKAGRWAIAGGANLASGTGTVYVWLDNGTVVSAADRHALEINAHPSGLAGSSIYTERPFVAGATVALWVWHNYGVLTNTDGAMRPWISARWLGD